MYYFERYGCTNSSYTQYNSNANVDNGTCTTLKVHGCTNSYYAEYHNQGFVANWDNGSCQTQAVFGCNSNALACNYNVPTNIDQVLLDVTVDNGGTCINAPGLIDNLTVRYDNLYEEAGNIGAIILEWDDVYTENNISKFTIEKKLNDGSYGPIKEHNYRTCPECPKSYTVDGSPKQAFYDFDKENCNNL